MARNDQRRRRVVMDEALHERSEFDSAALECAGPSDAIGADLANAIEYGTKAKRRNQLKTTDLLPKRMRALIGFGVVLGLLIAAINSIRWVAYSCIPNITAQAFDGVRLSSASSISTWFSSMLLMASCLASLQIYAVRQHRCNDYLGTYRVWLFFAAICLLGSLNCVVDFASLGPWIQQLGWVGSASAAFVATFAVKAVALSAIFVRGLIEVRSSRGALVLVSLAWVLYLCSLVMQFPQVKSQYVQEHDLYYGNMLLLAHATLLLSIVVFNRYIYLIANGLLQVATGREATVKPAVTKKVDKKLRSAPSKVETVDSEFETPVKTRRTKTKPLEQPAQVQPEEVAPIVEVPARKSGPLADRLKAQSQDLESIVEPPSQRPLNKSDRKRLKKLQQQQATQTRRAA